MSNENLQTDERREDPRVVERAMKYGYNQMFALWPHKQISECWENWTKNNDTGGLKMLLFFLNNRMAYDRAEEVLELEDKYEKKNQ